MIQGKVIVYHLKAVIFLRSEKRDTDQTEKRKEEWKCEFRADAAARLQEANVKSVFGKLKKGLRKSAENVQKTVLFSFSANPAALDFTGQNGIF